MATKSVKDYMSLSYPYELVLDQDQGGYFARHPDLPGCTAEGDSPQEAVENLDESRRLWIEARLDGGYSIPEPASEEYRGRISLRIPPSLHASLARSSARRDMSLNQLLTVILSEWAGGVSVSDRVEEQLSVLRTTLLAAEAMTVRANNKTKTRVNYQLLNGGGQRQISAKASQ
jgi:antitoxin HicB